MSRFPRERFSLNCEICGNEFDVVKSRLGKARFCSNKCRTDSGLLSNIVHKCDSCGDDVKELARHRHQINRNGANKFYCSRECFYAVNLRDKPIGTKRKCSATEYIFVKTSQDKWESEHRLIAESNIGRKLDYDSEPILHIDGRHYNNCEDNLYICRDRSEINTILKSYAIPYPVEGNLSWYK